ncbi:MAG: ribose 5-phosphate isomerase A [Hyphomicrobiales bacterium]|nr:MAG: ribose 5-phosphate isomerase A [Hyphomicrobiales bacterium]
MTPDEQKRMAAARALEYVEDGMKLGLGTGSTAAHFVDLLGERVAAGLNVLCVPTSEATHAQATGLNIPLTTLDETPALDLTIDGADELDAALNLVKGGGGALLREKIVATASSRMVVIADGSKVVETLGAFDLPVEVVPFGAGATVNQMREIAAGLGCNGEINRRKTADGKPFFTDGGHYIYDCAFGVIPDPVALAAALNMIAGVVETGLFCGIATLAVIAGPDGAKIMEPA